MGPTSFTGHFETVEILFALAPRHQVIFTEASRCGSGVGINGALSQTVIHSVTSTVYPVLPVVRVAEFGQTQRVTSRRSVTSVDRLNALSLSNPILIVI